MRKITFDNSVKHIPKNEQIREVRQTTKKNKSTLGKLIENISQKNKKFLNNLAAQGFAILE